MKYETINRQTCDYQSHVSELKLDLENTLLCVACAIVTYVKHLNLFKVSNDNAISQAIQ